MDATDGLRRGQQVTDTGNPDHGAGGRGDARPNLQPARRSDRPGRGGQDRGALADPPAGAERRGPRADGGDPGDRDQGHRPPGPVRQGRQGRAVRRRRRGQDGPDPGADPQHRRGARGPIGVLRRRRALPRGQRPLARDEGVGRHRQDDARLRPDERAAGRAPSGRSFRPDHGGVLPRDVRPGRAAVHRQHLPVRPGRLRGLGAPGPHALGGGLSADAGDRDGWPAGADHVDSQGLGHVDPGGLRPGRRPHRPGAGVGVRASQRDHDAVPRDLGEGHLPGGRPARLDLDDPEARDPRRGPLQHGDRGPGGAPALQGAPGHHRHPRDRRALRRGQDRGRPRAQDRALPLAAVLRRRGLHRPRGRVRPGRGDGARLPRDPRRQARRPVGGRLLHEGLDRPGDGRARS